MTRRIAGGHISRRAHEAMGTRSAHPACSARNRFYNTFTTRSVSPLSPSTMLSLADAATFSRTSSSRRRMSVGLSCRPDHFSGRFYPAQCAFRENIGKTLDTRPAAYYTGVHLEWTLSQLPALGKAGWLDVSRHPSRSCEQRRRSHEYATVDDRLLCPGAGDLCSAACCPAAAQAGSGT